MALEASPLLVARPVVLARPMIPEILEKSPGATRHEVAPDEITASDQWAGSLTNEQTTSDALALIPIGAEDFTPAMPACAIDPAPCGALDDVWRSPALSERVTPREEVMATPEVHSSGTVHACPRRVAP